MNITAQLFNRGSENRVELATEGNARQLIIPSKPNGQGSSINGGEHLLLALATCFCNDLYREAAKRNIRLTSVEVKATGIFGGEGEPAAQITYAAKVISDSAADVIRQLLEYTDKVAEVHNTLRSGIAVTLQTEY